MTSVWRIQSSAHGTKRQANAWVFLAKAGWIRALLPPAFGTSLAVGRGSRPDSPGLLSLQEHKALLQKMVEGEAELEELRSLRQDQVAEKERCGPGGASRGGVAAVPRVAF